MREREERKERPQQAAVRWDDLTDQILQDVLDIYDEVAFGKRIEREDYRLLYLQDAKEERGTHEFRFGSRLTMHSKLWMRHCYGEFDDDVVAFTMQDNLDRRHEIDETKKEGREMEDAFRLRVLDYLKSDNLLFTHESLRI